MDEPTSTRRAARKAKGGRRRLATEWVVIPLIIVLVVALVFGVKLFLGADLALAQAALAQEAALAAMTRADADAASPIVRHEDFEALERYRTGSVATATAVHA